MKVEIILYRFKKNRSPIEWWIVSTESVEDWGWSQSWKNKDSPYKSCCWNYYWISILISTAEFITGFLNFWNWRSTSIFVEVDLHDPSLDWTPDFFSHLVNHLNFIGKLLRRSQGTPEKSKTPGKTKLFTYFRILCVVAWRARPEIQKLGYLSDQQEFLDE